MASFHAAVSSLRRGARLASLVTVAVLWGAPVAWSASGASPGGIHVVSADESRIVLEVSLDAYTFEPSRYVEGTERLVLPDFGSFSDAGQPLIPARHYLVALPPDGAFQLRYSVLRTEPLGRHRLEPVPFPTAQRDDEGAAVPTEEYRIDDRVYQPGGSVIKVEADAPGRLRYQRVLPIRVFPVAYDPATGETLIATSIRVEITLSGRSSGSAGRGDLFKDAASRAPIQESGVWERIESRLLVNPEQAKTWRSRPISASESALSAAKAASAAAGPLVKLRVRTSGLHRVKASTVIAKGFPGGTPVTQLHVFQRAYKDNTYSERIVDVPYRVIEDPTGMSGTFDGSDVVIFYGQSIRSDTLRHDPIAKFSNDNIYWLGADSGPTIDLKAAPAGTVRADTATVSFPTVNRNEEDLWFQEQTPPGMTEFYYYNQHTVNQLTAPFTESSINPNGTFQVKAEFLGGDTQRSLREVQLSIVNSKGTTPLNSAYVPLKNRVAYTSQVVPNSALAEGVNSFVLKPSSERTLIEVLLSNFTILSSSLCRAVGNVLEFNTGSFSGATNLSVTGLGRTDVRLFDVTDPLVPYECVLTPSHFAAAGAGYVLSFVDNVTAQRRYIITPVDKIHELTDADVLADQPSTLIGGPYENGVDILVVSHANFLGEIQRWVDYRRAQGYRVLLTDVEDVFDEFDGGVRNPRAIRKCIKHFFDKGGLSYVLLVGDASEDNKRVDLESGPNFVPTESYSEHVFGGGFDEDEVVTTDKWYAMLKRDILHDTSTSLSDFMPDVIIGRMPVGTPQELKAVVDKVLSFEAPKGDDFWRRRMIRVADDAWSYGSDFQSCYQPAEVGFEQAEESAANVIENAMPGGFDVVRFYLSNRIAHPAQGTCVTGSVQTNRCRMSATPALLSELDRGATWVSFQNHMNRYQMCHEWLFTSSTTSPDGLKDPGRLTNTGRPFIAFGMGCHMSDYAINKELVRYTYNPPNGDALAEILLFLANKGAVSTYGSSGYEYLTPNVRYTDILARTIYQTPPTDAMVGSGKRQARWILGELMTIAEIENISRYGVGGSGDGAVGQAKRYHILGDPVLRVDGGPPRFEVTVDGKTVQSGDPVFSASGSDSIDVVAVITDEVAIERLSVTIDGVDETGAAIITPLVDQTLDAARKYRVRFKHKIMPKAYDIVIQAEQAADTTGTGYNIVSQFVLKVELGVTFRVNGRPIAKSGDIVPPKGDFAFELHFPVVVDPGLIHAAIDGQPVGQFDLVHPTPQDSTTWVLTFSPNLPNGKHTISVFVDTAEFPFEVAVGGAAGVREVIAYPNPFQDDTYFVYTNDQQITSGTIDVFTVSGHKVAHLDIPPASRGVGQNAVHWDGRTPSGGDIANGVYLFVINVDQGGKRSTERGKLVRTK